MRRVVSVFLPHWPAERLRRKLSLPSPLLVAARVGARQEIVGVDAAALALGLSPGMSLAQAQAMHAGLHVVPADPQGDARGLTALAQWCVRQYSPLAAPCPPDGVWIDSTGADHLCGGEAALLEGLVQRLNRAGFSARAALAGTPGAAHAMARFGGGGMAADPGAAIADLPVAALRLPEDTVDALRRLGFERISQLMAAPRAPLARRFGGVPLLRLDQALGRVAEPIEPVALANQPRARMGFLEPIATPEDLARAVTLLVDALCEKLTRKGLGAQCLDLVFTRIDGMAQSFRVGTAAPSRDPKHLARLLLPGIETIDPGLGVERILLAASRAAPLGAVQTEALAPPQTPIAELADTLRNRLAARLYRAQPVESDIPERAVRHVSPLAPPGGVSWPDRLPRPPRLLSPPREIEVMALLPDHPPARFVWRRRSYRVTQADGPERVYGEWWRDPDAHTVRDYFQVEDEAGQRFWLFRQGDGEDAATGDMRWFLHGFF